MRRRNTTTALAAILAAVAATGCEHTTTVHSSPIGAADLPGSDFDTKPTPPVQPGTHFAAGQLAESRGDLDAAATQYQLAVTKFAAEDHLGPADQAAYQTSLYRLGMILTAERKPEAVPVWQQYVSATGGTATSYSDLGFALDLAGRPAEAATAFRAGIAKDPQCESCRVNYGRLLARQHKMDDAAAQLAAVLTPAEVEFDLGAVFEQQGDRSDAAAHYHRALKLDPNLSDAKVRLAEVE